MLVERLPSTQNVVGSNPARGSSFFLSRKKGVVFGHSCLLCLVSLNEFTCRCVCKHLACACVWDSCHQDRSQMREQGSVAEATTHQVGPEIDLLRDITNTGVYKRWTGLDWTGILD